MPGDRREAARVAARAGAGVTARGAPRGAARRRAAAARGHPRHRRARSRSPPGSAFGPVVAGAAALAAGAWRGAGRRGRSAVALLAVGAVLGRRAAFADARLAALDAGSLRAMPGERWERTRPCSSRFASTAATPPRACGSVRAAVAAVRVRASAHRRPRSGLPRGVAGRRGGGRPRRARRAAREYDAFQARRGAHAALEVGPARATGAWRGGCRRARPRAAARGAGLARGLPGEEAALLRGMVLGQDERLSEAVRTDFRRSGLAHLLAVRVRTSMLLACSCSRPGMVAGCRLRARLALGARARRALRAAGGRRPVDPAGGGDGRRRARRRARGAAGVALVRARARRRRDARAQPARVGGAGWQLSFAAVVGLLALAPRWREGLRRARVPGAARRRRPR